MCRFTNVSVKFPVDFTSFILGPYCYGMITRIIERFAKYDFPKIALKSESLQGFFNIPLMNL